MHIKTAAELKTAITDTSTKAVYVAIMMGNMVFSSKISKKEALDIANEIEKTWADKIEDLDVQGYGYLQDGILHLGGL